MLLNFLDFVRHVNNSTMKIMKKIVSFSLLLLLIIVSVIFIKQQDSSVTNASGLQVAASFYPMYFFSSQIGGMYASAFTITPASSEPHDYEPTTQDIVRIIKSNMLVLNGGNLEPWADKITDQLQGSNVVVITAGENIINKHINENGQTILDPHVWLDPQLAKKQVEVISNGFQKIDSKHAPYFQANAQKLEKQLDELDKEFRQGLSRCQKKDFVTSHAAFGYLAARYGLHQVAISGLSPDEEPSSQKLAEITTLVKKEEIKVIFFERLVSPKLSQTIGQETGAQILVLDPIEGITQEDLRAGKNYLTVMKENLASLQIALDCKK